MGSVIWREEKQAFVIQWQDAGGKQKQRVIRGKGFDGTALSKRTQERDAQRRLAEIETSVSRQRDGLEPISGDEMKRPFKWLFDWWWNARGKTLKSPNIKEYLEKHLTSLWELPLNQVTADQVIQLLEEKAVELSPKSRKHLRAYLFTIYSRARKPGGPWHGRANPIEDVPPVKVPKVPRYILQPHEMGPVVEQVDIEWRGVVATGLYSGLREGEIFGLRKADVDFEQNVLTVWRSWDADRTKDAKVGVVPIAPPLLPFLKEAMKTPGEFVFPDTKGEMQPRELRLGKVMKRALSAAGIVIGYQWRCRAWRCGWKERRPSKTVPDLCPKCHKLTTWAKPIPRHVRFHDTRHSYGTQMVRTAGLAVAQKGLRHSDSRLTSDTYGHLDLGDLRKGILASFPEAPEEASKSLPGHCRVLKTAEPKKKKGRNP